jgi:hypothetical protein
MRFRHVAPCERPATATPSRAAPRRLAAPALFVASALLVVARPVRVTAQDAPTGASSDISAETPAVVAAEGEPAVEPEPAPTPTVAASAPATPSVPSGPSVESGPSGTIPIRFELHGYYRARFNWMTNVPVVDSNTVTPIGSAFGAYVFGRLRLDPAILYGTDPTAPIAAVRLQIDALDNVIFGDNARLQSTPLFGETPSMTDIDGRDVGPFLLRRAWVEFLLPVGQIRIGRQPSQGGLGILFNDGNGFRNDWGDARYGTTFDRFLFATRPLTIINTLTRGDSRPTPLVFAIAHDWLVEDPIGTASAAPYAPTGPDTSFSPPGTLARSTLPFQNVLNGRDDVTQTFGALVWNDPKINPLRSSDELQIGGVFVYRAQKLTESDVFIPDLFWKTRLSPFGNRAPQLVLNGEVFAILGTSRGLPFPSLGFDPNTGRTAQVAEAGIWGAVVQAGLAQDQQWQALLEWGYSSGDRQLTDTRLTQRPFNPDYNVGMVMYQIALQAVTAEGYNNALRAFRSRGGVWNSQYFFPQFKYRLVKGGLFNSIDVHGAFLLAWADELNIFTDAIIAREERGIRDADTCGAFEPDCFLGWEVDLALKVNWGDNDMLRWSTEFGFMDARGPLRRALSADTIWTLQTRMAVVF